MIYRLIGASLALFLACINTACAAEADYASWPTQPLSHPDGLRYEDPAANAWVDVFKVGALEKAAGDRSLSTYGDGARARIEFALSIIAIDLYGEETFADGVFAGVGASSEGEIEFSARLTGDEPDDELVVRATSLEPAPAKVAEEAVAKADERPAEAKEEPKPTVAAGEPIYVAGYPLPQKLDGAKSWVGWTALGGDQHVAKPGDPKSPRQRQVKGLKKSMTPEAAAKAAFRTLKIPNARIAGLKEVETSRMFVGNEFIVGIGTGRLGGAPSVIFFGVHLAKDANERRVVVNEMTRETFDAWGGVTAMMLADGVIKSIDDVPEATRRKIVAAPLENQLALYVDSYNKLMMAYAQGIMMTQAQRR